MTVTPPSVAEYLEHKQQRGRIDEAAHHHCAMHSPTRTCSGMCSQGDSWLPWRVLLIAAMGEALTDDERLVFTQLTGREREPLQRVNEFERLSGGAAARHLRWPLWPLTSPPVAITVMRSPAAKPACCSCVAQDTKIAKLLLDFVRGQSHRQRDPAPAHQGPHARRHRADQQHHHRSEAQHHSASYAARLTLASSRTSWRSGSLMPTYANPDVEVLAAARPGLLTTGGPLIMASSPYAKMGVLVGHLQQALRPRWFS